MPAPEVDLVYVATHVGRTSRQTCGDCHFSGGGGDAVAPAAAALAGVTFGDGREVLAGPKLRFRPAGLFQPVPQQGAPAASPRAKGQAVLAGFNFGRGLPHHHHPGRGRSAKDRPAADKVARLSTTATLA